MTLLSSLDHGNNPTGLIQVQVSKLPLLIIEPLYVTFPLGIFLLIESWLFGLICPSRELPSVHCLRTFYSYLLLTTVCLPSVSRLLIRAVTSFLVLIVFYCTVLVEKSCDLRLFLYVVGLLVNQFFLWLFKVSFFVMI